MIYHVNRIYKTIQGEGYHAGKVAVFVRFSGCNLWSGREQDRQTAICKICDTSFIDSIKMSRSQIVDAVCDYWQSNEGKRFVVLTGGEPSLQVTSDLINEFYEHGFYVAIETNGAKPFPCNIDWVTFSPKTNNGHAITASDELKIVYPLPTVDPKQFDRFAADHKYIVPLDDANKQENTLECVKFVMSNPNWRISLQIHKYLGID